MQQWETNEVSESTLTVLKKNTLNMCQKLCY